MWIKTNLNNSSLTPVAETRAGVGTIHLFGGKNRVASVLSDGRIQFYHPNHLRSASVVTDAYGDSSKGTLVLKQLISRRLGI